MINFVQDQIQDCESNSQVVQSGYFRDRMSYFQEHYKDKFPKGWGEFFAAYSNRCTDEGNLDYDEWAFLCEHFMRERTSWQPPENCAESREKPETISGFYFVWGKTCLTQIYILET
jgi:hypothetical protein